MWWALAGVVALGATLWGPIVSDVEQAEYTVIKTYENQDVEIRDYAPMIVAQTIVEGQRDEAISKGFKKIAGYIFGDNVSQKKVAMTAPVTQESGEEIAMTAPVMQESSEKIAMTAPVSQQKSGGNWKVRFVMPSQYTMETLPKPVNDSVKLEKVDGKRFVVIRFSGMGGTESLKEHTNELMSFIEGHDLTVVSEKPTYAFYNPPWTLPFLRRNEVMIEVAK